MHRASTLAAAALAVTGALALAGAASAQSPARAPGQPAPTAGQAQGLRYLSWPGRGETPAPASRDTAPPAPGRPNLRRPNPVIPHGGFAAAEPAAPGALTSAPGPARRTLTPANAWLRPAPPTPEPAPPAPPVTVAAPPPSAPSPRPVPEYLPDQGGRGQPAPAEVIYPAPARSEEAPAAAPADPLAPRRDAPIFRMQQDAPPVRVPEPAPQATPRAETARPGEPAEARRVMAVANSGEGPSREGARYYSVHRQNGREPDAMVMPQPTYVDALVVTMTETPATQDLAEPGPGPTLIRDRNGSMRPVPASSDGDHQ